VDGQLCFESFQIELPIGYTWGITAVSAELPDTFEVYKMAVSTDSLSVNHEAAMSPDKEGQNVIPPSFLDNPIASNAEYKDEFEADKIQDDQQFADLHSSLHAIMNHLLALQHEYTLGHKAIEKQLNDLQTRVSSIPVVNCASAGDVQAIDKRLEALELQIQHVRHAVSDKGQIEDLKRTVKETHSSLLAAVPRHSFLILVFLGSQALLVGLYIIYKRRRANGPKKYL
jgi:lectin, mannose-binding 1